MPTNTDVLLPIQRALFELLELELTVDVHDDVPDDAGFPYVVIGDATTTPDNTLTAFGHRTVVTVHVWSAFAGYSEALGIAGQLVALLDHQALDLAGDGLEVVAQRHEQTVTLRDPDRDVRHVPVRFAIYTEPTA